MHILSTVWLGPQGGETELRNLLDCVHKIIAHAKIGELILIDDVIVG